MVSNPQLLGKAVDEQKKKSGEKKLSPTTVDLASEYLIAASISKPSLEKRQTVRPFSAAERPHCAPERPHSAAVLRNLLGPVGALL